MRQIKYSPKGLLYLMLNMVFVVLLMGIADAASTTRASRSSAGVQGNDGSWISSITRYGGKVAFDSDATNLVSGDTNGVSDIFVRTTLYNQTIRVSLSSGGVEGNSTSYSPSVSADGRYVAFESDATNLITGDTNSATDIFLRDTQTNQTYRVSRSTAGAEGNGNSFFPSISGDGRFVAFVSSSTNLVSGDTNGVNDIFVRDRQTGITTRVSVSSGGTQGNGHSTSPSISADGRYVAFESDATNLVGDDTNGFKDVFVYDRNTGVSYRVSKSSSGSQVYYNSYSPSISRDGRYVAFMSDAPNLVSYDWNYVPDVFVRDRQTGITSRVSVNDSGTEGDDMSYYPSISGDGRFVAFGSDATNLVMGDTNYAPDIFVRDRQTNKTYRMSVSSVGVEGNSTSYYPSISGTGRYVSFWSFASNLVSGDTNGVADVFVRDWPSVTCDELVPSIVGTAGDDVITGTYARDIIHGLGGNDTISGSSGDDLICGGSGNDIINGNDGQDKLIGQDGNDDIWGGYHNDELKGGLGDDDLNGETETDTCDGGPHVFGDTAWGCETITNIP